MGYYLINILKFNFFLSLILAMIGTAILVWLLNFSLSSSAKFDSDCGFDYSHWGPLSSEYGMIFFVGANTRSLPAGY